MLFLLFPWTIFSAEYCLCDASTTCQTDCSSTATKVFTATDLNSQLNSITGENLDLFIYIDTNSDPVIISAGNHINFKVNVVGNDKSINKVQIDFATFSSGSTFSFQLEKVNADIQNTDISKEIIFDDFIISSDSSLTNVGTLTGKIESKLECDLALATQFGKLTLKGNINFWLDDFTTIEIDDTSISIDSGNQIFIDPAQIYILFSVKNEIDATISSTNSLSTITLNINSINNNKASFSFTSMNNIQKLIINSPEIYIQSATVNFPIEFPSTLSLTMPISCRRILNSFTFSDPTNSKLYLIDDDVQTVTFSSTATVELATSTTGQELYLELSNIVTFLELNQPKPNLFSIKGTKTDNSFFFTLILSEIDNYFNIEDDQSNSIKFERKASASASKLNVFYSSSSKNNLINVNSEIDLLFISFNSICISATPQTECTTEESQFYDIEFFNKAINSLPTNSIKNSFDLNVFLTGQETIYFPLNKFSTTDLTTFTFNGHNTQNSLEFHETTTNSILSLIVKEGKVSFLKANTLKLIEFDELSVFESTELLTTESLIGIINSYSNLPNNKIKVIQQLTLTIPESTDKLVFNNALISFTNNYVLQIDPIDIQLTIKGKPTLEISSSVGSTFTNMIQLYFEDEATLTFGEMNKNTHLTINNPSKQIQIDLSVLSSSSSKFDLQFQDQVKIKANINIYKRIEQMTFGNTNSEIYLTFGAGVPISSLELSQNNLSQVIVNNDASIDISKAQTHLDIPTSNGIITISTGASSITSTSTYKLKLLLNEQISHLILKNAVESFISIDKSTTSSDIYKCYYESSDEQHGQQLSLNSNVLMKWLSSTSICIYESTNNMISQCDSIVGSKLTISEFNEAKISQLSTDFSLHVQTTNNEILLIPFSICSNINLHFEGQGLTSSLISFTGTSDGSTTIDLQACRIKFSDTNTIKSLQIDSTSRIETTQLITIGDFYADLTNYANIPTNLIRATNIIEFTLIETTNIISFTDSSFTLESQTPSPSTSTIHYISSSIKPTLTIKGKPTLAISSTISTVFSNSINVNFEDSVKLIFNEMTDSTQLTINNPSKQIQIDLSVLSSSSSKFDLQFQDQVKIKANINIYKRIEQMTFGNTNSEIYLTFGAGVPISSLELSQNNLNQVIVNNDASIDISKAQTHLDIPTSNGIITISTGASSITSTSTYKLKLLLNEQISHLILKNAVESFISIDKSTTSSDIYKCYYESSDEQHGQQLSLNSNVLMKWLSSTSICIYESTNNMISQCDSIVGSKLTISEFNEAKISQLSTDFSLHVQTTNNEILLIPFSICSNINLHFEGQGLTSSLISFTGTSDGSTTIDLQACRIKFDTQNIIKSLSYDENSCITSTTNTITVKELKGPITTTFNTGNIVKIDTKAIFAVPDNLFCFSVLNSQISFSDVIGTTTSVFTITNNAILDLTYHNPQYISISSDSTSSIDLVIQSANSLTFNFDKSKYQGISSVVIKSSGQITFADPPNSIKFTDVALSLFDAFAITLENPNIDIVFSGCKYTTLYTVSDAYIKQHNVEFKFTTLSSSIQITENVGCVSPRYILTTSSTDSIVSLVATKASVNNLPIVFDNEAKLFLSLQTYSQIDLTLNDQAILRLLNTGDITSISPKGVKSCQVNGNKLISFTKELIVENPFSLDKALTVTEIAGKVTIYGTVEDSKIDFSRVSTFDPTLITLATGKTTIYTIVNQINTGFTLDTTVTGFEVIVFNIKQVCLCLDIQSEKNKCGNQGSIIHSTEKFNKAKPITPFTNDFTLLNYLPSTTDLPELDTKLIGDSHSLKIIGSTDASTVLLEPIDTDVIDLYISLVSVKFTKGGTFNQLSVNNHNTPAAISDSTPGAPITIRANTFSAYETFLSTTVTYSIQNSINLDINKDSAGNSLIIQKGSYIFKDGELISYDSLCQATFVTSYDLTVKQTITNNADIGDITIHFFSARTLSFTGWSNALFGTNRIKLITISDTSTDKIINDIVSKSLTFTANSKVPVSFDDGSIVKISISTLKLQEDPFLVGQNGYLIIDSTEKTNTISLKSESIELKTNLNTFTLSRPTSSGTLVLIMQSKDNVVLNNADSEFGTVAKLAIISKENGGFDFTSFHNYPLSEKHMIITTNPSNKNFYAYVKNTEISSKIYVQQANMITFNVDSCCICDKGNSECYTDKYCGSSYTGSILTKPSDFESYSLVSPEYILINAYSTAGTLKIQASAFNNITIISKTVNSLVFNINLDNCKSTNHLHLVDTKITDFSGTQADTLGSMTFIGTCEITSAASVRSNDIVIDYPCIGTAQFSANNLLWIKKLENCRLVTLAKDSVIMSTFKIYFSDKCYLQYDDNFITNIETTTTEETFPNYVKLLFEKSGDITFSHEFGNMKLKNKLFFESLNEFITISSTTTLPIEFIDGSLIKMSFDTLLVAGNPLVGLSGKFQLINTDENVISMNLGSQTIELIGTEGKVYQISTKEPETGSIFIENSLSGYSSFILSFSEKIQVFPSVSIVATKPYSRITVNEKMIKNVVTLSSSNSDIKSVIIDSIITDVSSYFLLANYISSVYQFNKNKACVCSEKTTDGCLTNDRCGIDFDGSIFYSIEEFNIVSKTKFNEGGFFDLRLAFTVTEDSPTLSLKGVPSKSTVKISSKKSDSQYVNLDLSVDDSLQLFSGSGCNLILDNVEATFTGFQSSFSLNSLELYQSNIQTADTGSTVNTINIKRLNFDDTSKFSSRIYYYCQQVNINVTGKESNHYKFDSTYFLDSHSTQIGVSQTSNININSKGNSLQLSRVLGSTSKLFNSNSRSLLSTITYTINLDMNSAESLDIVGDFSNFQNDAIIINSLTQLDLEIDSKSTPILFEGPCFPRLSFNSLLNIRNIFSVGRTGTLTIKSSTLTTVTITDKSVICSDSKKNSLSIISATLAGKLIIENGYIYPNYLTVNFGDGTNEPSEKSTSSVTFLSISNEVAYLLESDDWTFKKYPKSILSFQKDETNIDIKKIYIMNNNEDISLNFEVSNSLEVVSRPVPTLVSPTATPNRATMATVIGITVGCAFIIIIAIVITVIMVVRKHARKNKINAADEETDDTQLEKSNTAIKEEFWNLNDQSSDSYSD